MAKTVTRKLLKLFGLNGDADNFGQFGSVRAGSPLKTKDVSLIQALSAWLTGWQDEVVDSNKAPFLEDMNSIMYVMIYQLFYLLQEGIPEWDSTTTYFIGSRVRKPGTQEVYGSLTNDNTGNALPSATDNINWKFIYPVRFPDLVGSIGLSQIPDGFITASKIISLAASQLTGLVTNSQIQDLAVSKLISGPISPSIGGTGIGTKIFVSSNYVGNGAARSVAHNLGVAPNLVIIMQMNNGTQSPEIWGDAFAANVSREMNGNVNTNAILSVDAANVNIGSSAVINTNGLVYMIFAFRTQ